MRTANDSYFTAMTYPEGLPSLLQPSDLHDATWGIFAAVYGGAIHPTAEGHAAMADAALPAVREVLGLPAPAAPVRSEPLPPPQLPRAENAERRAVDRIGHIGSPDGRTIAPQAMIGQTGPSLI